MGWAHNTSEHLSLPVHRSRPWQVQLFEGAVEYQCYLDIASSYVQLALGNCLSVGLRWQVKNSWGHDHDPPSQAIHFHSSPATSPEQRPLVQIHLQLVGTCKICLSHQVGNRDTNSMDTTCRNTYKPSRPLHSPCIMNLESPNIDAPISGISVRTVRQV